MKRGNDDKSAGRRLLRRLLCMRAERVVAPASWTRNSVFADIGLAKQTLFPSTLPQDREEYCEASHGDRYECPIYRFHRQSHPFNINRRNSSTLYDIFFDFPKIFLAREAFSCLNAKWLSRPGLTIRTNVRYYNYGDRLKDLWRLAWPTTPPKQ
jgi:hypothetical protein